RLATGTPLSEVVRDTYLRSRSGGVFYLLGWLIVALSGAAFAAEPAIAWAITAGFAVLGPLRFRFAPPATPDAARQTRWLRLQFGVVIATTSLWGGVALWALRDPRLAGGLVPALMCSVSFATALMHTYCVRRDYASFAVGVFYGPLLVALWADPAQRPMAFMFSIYLVYLVLALLRAHADYHRRLSLELQLRNQRDAFEQLSSTDGLTGLANRRRFNDALAEAVATARAQERALTLAILDLDHFKVVNDRFGHAVGDACLTTFAGLLEQQLGGSLGFTARLGGEEFGVVFGGVTAEDAVEYAERFRASLTERRLEGTGGFHISVSIGVAAHDPTRHHTADDLYREADRALYLAKTQGRDRVCRAG
ncbi:MAG TPA: GGDEF domain-containing protein, partial [Xanthomonadales bacterium]|nr:GGDEF domain-containing protein [Xanthomonadales bacterium]